jgi:hypothetical protein
VWMEVVSPAFLVLVVAWLEDVSFVVLPLSSDLCVAIVVVVAT